jgi:hypothetical protein
MVHNPLIYIIARYSTNQTNEFLASIFVFLMAL